MALRGKGNGGYFPIGELRATKSRYNNPVPEKETDYQLEVFNQKENSLFPPIIFLGKKEEMIQFLQKCIKKVGNIDGNGAGE